MNTKRLLYHFTLGILIGLLVFPPLTTHAFPVFDAPAHAQRIRAELKRAKEWVDTIKHYQEMYRFATENLTNLRGILRVADIELMKNGEVALLANDIATIMNDSRGLKQKLEGMVRYQVMSLRNIDNRLSRGIFDPDQDWRDFQNYLLYTMGRDARQTINHNKRLAMADAELTTLLDEQQQLRVELATQASEAAQLKKELDKVKKDNRVEQINIQQLNEKITDKDKQISETQKRLKDLNKQIAERYKKWSLRFEDMENFGHEVESNLAMWNELQKTKVDLQRTLDALATGKSAPRTE